jgi:hypothetical protein
MVSNSELQLLASAAQAIFALGLLIATGVYTYYTRLQSDATHKQIDAMGAQTTVINDQTKAMSRPYLKATIEHPNFAEYFFAIRNTGNGAAHDVTAEWDIGTDGEDRSWNIPLIAPGEKHQFIITKTEDNSIVSAAKQIEEVLSSRGYELRFEADCEDIFGESHHFEEEIDLERAIWGRKEASYEWVKKPADETVAENIQSISDDFRDVGNVASTLRRELSGILRSYQKDQCLSRIKEYGELSIEQLAHLSHKDPHLLRHELQVLADQGLVEFDEESDKAKIPTEE